MSSAVEQPTSQEWKSRWVGEGRLYKTSDGRFLAVSAVVIPRSGPETYIFEADEEGNVLDWGELDGSFEGDLDHVRALNRAGYNQVESI